MRGYHYHIKVISSVKKTDQSLDGMKGNVICGGVSDSPIMSIDSMVDSVSVRFRSFQFLEFFKNN